MKSEGVSSDKKQCRTRRIRDGMQLDIGYVPEVGSTTSKTGCRFLAFLLRTRHIIDLKRLFLIQLNKNKANSHAFFMGVRPEIRHFEIRCWGHREWRLPVSRKPPSILVREKDVWLAPNPQSRIPFAALGYVGLHSAFKRKSTNNWLTAINLIM